MINRVISLIAVISVSVAALAACTDDAGTNNAGNDGFNPGTGTDGGGSSGDVPDGGPDTTDGGCPNQPPGCFCGTPTTQAQFLNRCTRSVALPVNLTVKPATTADIP